MMTNNKNVEDKSKNKKSIKKDTVRTCSQTLSCLINQVDNINDIQFRFLFNKIGEENRKLENYTIRLCEQCTYLQQKYKKEHGVYPVFKDLFGYADTSGYAYHLLFSDNNNRIINYIDSHNVNSITRDVCSHYNKAYKQILAGTCHPASYGTNQPITIRADNIKLNRVHKNVYTFQMIIFNKKGVKNFNQQIDTYNATLEQQILENPEMAKKAPNKIDHIKDTFVTFNIKADAYGQDILERCLSGEYRMGASKIVRCKNYKSKDKQYKINLSYSFAPHKLGLDKTKVMGIDVNIFNPVYCAFNFNDNSHCFIADNSVLNIKYRMTNYIHRMQKSKAQIGNGSRGHGRQKVLKFFRKMNHHIHNLQNTKNNQWSAWVIQMALKNNCGTIAMEDLSAHKVTDNDKEDTNEWRDINQLNHTGIERRLQQSTWKSLWAWYDLQQKIEYKAKRNGIKVVKVNPAYTSQECHFCHTINAKNRPLKNDKGERDHSYFKCVKCGKTFDADFNAAKNIANRGLDIVLHPSKYSKDKKLKVDLQI